MKKSTVTSALRFALFLLALCPAAICQQFVPGRVLAGFRDNIPQSKSDEILNAVGATAARTIPGLRVRIISLPPHASEQATVNALRNRPEIEFAELDRVLAPSDLIPDDPYYANWEWHLPKISAPAAWSITTGSSAITIAILDTGFYTSHPDLAPKLLPGWNVYNNTADLTDVYGHGTKTAGTAAAASNNGAGVASVAWGCPILPVKISDDTGMTTYSAAAAGLTWAADHGARVANISYTISDSATVTSAAQYFWNKGGVVTASAGNASTFDTAAANPYILTISATDPNDALYSWSNYGNNIDLAAPGSVFTTTSEGTYGSAAGTSFSAPITAGVAALVLSVNPHLTPAQVVSILRNNADDLGAAGWDPYYGWGRVNAARAVAAALGTPAGPAVTFQSPASGSTISGVISAQIAASDSSGIASVAFYADSVLTGTLAAPPYTWSVDTTRMPNGSHAFQAVAKDTLGYSSSATSTVTISNVTVDATPPTASITAPAAGSTAPQNLSVSVTAADNIGVTAVDLLIDGVSSATLSSSPYVFKVNTKRWTQGAHTLQARAHDKAGNLGLSAILTVSK